MVWIVRVSYAVARHRTGSRGGRRFIHGGRDFVIPAKRVKPDRVVARGGHLINMSHAAEVNEFIVHCAREAALL